MAEGPVGPRSGARIFQYAEEKRTSRVSVESPASSSSSQPTTAQPQYSIVVPAFNESARLGATLEQILDHVRQRRWNAEVVVVDDGSRDDTLEIATRFAATHPQVRLIQNPGNQDTGYAGHKCMLHARGRSLLFTDADLSSPISEAVKLFAALESRADVALGSPSPDPLLQLPRQSLHRQ